MVSFIKNFNINEEYRLLKKSFFSENSYPYIANFRVFDDE